MEIVLDMSTADMALIKRILCLFKPYIKKIALIFFCLMMSTGLNLLTPKISQLLLDKGLLAHDYKLLVIFALTGLSLLLTDQGLGFLEAKIRIYLNSMITFTLSKNAFQHTLKMKMHFLNNTNATEIMNTVSTDVDNIGRVCDSSTFYIVSSVFKMIGGLIGLALIDWRLTIMVVAIVPFRYILVKYFAKKRKQSFKDYININQKLSAFYGDTITGIKEIKLWGLDRIKTSEFVKIQRTLINSNIKMGLTDKANEFSETVLFQVITDLIYIVGAQFVFHNNLTVGELFAFITYSTYVTGPISAILNIGYNFTNILPSAKRYFDFMDTEGESYGERLSAGVDDKGRNAVIAYENVSFSYSDDKKVLDKISFEINEGEIVAIVGANGSGKSTVINLLLRLYQPTTGKILVNGVDINAINLRKYRRLISVVSQDIYLFNASIKENIALNTKLDELHIYKTVKECGISEFIERLPDRYDTMIGKNGTGVSGGEKQKIAMARAIIRDSKILVLDEATANYDAASEAYLNNFIGKELNGKTVIIISHKQDILRHANKIILLENGQIACVGKHDDLYGSSGIYKKMFENHAAFSEKSDLTSGINSVPL